MRSRSRVTAARPSRRVKAPVSRFSSIVRCPKQWRPSMTWIAPRRTRSLGESLSTRSPSNRIEPLVTSPRSARMRFEIAFKVVVLPAPLAPSSATTPAPGHRERDALQHQRDRIVDDLDVEDVEDGRGGGGSAAVIPHYAGSDRTRHMGRPGPQAASLSPAGEKAEGVTLCITHVLSQGSVRAGQPAFFSA